MSGMSLTFTSVGLAALVNAQATGSVGVLVSQVGLASAPFTVAGTLTALPNEIKRLATFGGAAVDPATIHISIRDDSADAFDLFGFGLYLNDGTLFAVYSQPTRILGKAAISQALISLDVRLAAAVAGNILFGATDFLDPPATTERAGLVELATSPETLAGTDLQRAVTPAGLKAKTDAVTAEAHTYADTKKAEAIAAAAADAAGKANAAQAAAIATAAGDATTKANAAQAAAIAAIDALIAGAPGALNTLKELADAMGDDPNFAATITNLVATKKAEAIAAAAADATTKANAAQAAAQGYADTKKTEAIAAAAADATAKANAAQAAAIATAAGDATTKANNAQAAAQGYADVRKAEAIAAAAADAQARANAAEANVWQPGDIKYRAYGTVPAGWSLADGGELSRSTHAALFAVIGTSYGAGNGSTTFNKPDYRGEFLRGWDAGRGADPGRGLGTWQDSQNLAHSHTFPPVPRQGTGGGYSGVNGVNGTIAETDVSGGTESRPRNMSVMVLIKL